MLQEFHRWHGFYSYCCDTVYDFRKVPTGRVGSDQDSTCFYSRTCSNMLRTPVTDQEFKAWAPDEVCLRLALSHHSVLSSPQPYETRDKPGMINNGARNSTENTQHQANMTRSALFKAQVACF